MSKFVSDWRDAFQQAWDWFNQVAKTEKRRWTTSDWKRLVDLHRLAEISDATEFDRLSLIVQSEKCVPDKDTLRSIGKWKSYERTSHLLKKNSNEKVRSTTAEAFRMIRGRDLIHESEDAMKHLRHLQGVGIATASALLAMYDPKNFAVIDRLAYGELFPNRTDEITSYAQWKEYLDQVMRLAHAHNLDCRDIDTALWFVGSFRASEKRRSLA